ncbi:uncharacterized protein [Nicotiana tomentosiformis]|uniref:uncharacterized protein n=1 Tax=Nicotiana tomentosiformis TaxID=4098 RepID=UPI00388C72ED
MASASNLNEKSLEATKMLKESLREFPATTWNDVYNRYSTKLWIEEDTVAQPRVDERPGSRRSESERSIIFDDEDAYGLMIPHSDALVISLLVYDTNVKRVLIDPDSSVNIILLRVVNEMQANDKVIPKARSLSGFDNSSIVTKWEVVLSTFAKGVIKDTKFQPIDADIAYNIILGRLWIHDVDVIPSTLHQVIKFPSHWGNRQIHGDQQASRRQPDVDSRPDVIQELEENENIKTTTEELEVVILIHWPDRKVYIGANLSPEMKGKLIEFLRANADYFDWAHSDITGIPPKVTTHKLNKDPLHSPIKQKKRKQGAFKNQMIQDEVQKLLKIGLIREVKYPDWLANTVVVPKKNEKWRVCVEYTDLNKACRKDSFPLSHID